MANKVTCSQSRGFSISVGFGRTVWLALHQASILSTRAQGSGNCIGIGFHASCEHDVAATPPCGYRRTEGNLKTTSSTGIHLERGVGILLDRKLFYSKQCLISLEIDGLDQPHNRHSRLDLMRRCFFCLSYIRWYGIASLELDHVTWDYFCPGKGFNVAPSVGSCSRGTQGPQGVHCLFGTEILDKAHDDVEGNGGGKDSRLMYAPMSKLTAMTIIRTCTRKLGSF